LWALVVGVRRKKAKYHGILEIVCELCHKLIFKKYRELKFWLVIQKGGMAAAVIILNISLI